MQKKSLPRLSAAMAGAILASAIPGRLALGDTYLDQIGLTQLRAEVPTLTGAGVTIAQPEATTVDEGTNFDHDNYQVNALTAGVTATITYLGTSGTFQSFSAIQESGHAIVVAKYLANTTLGVAPGISRLLNINANWYANGYILPNNGIPFSPKVLNQSFSETPSGPYTAPVLDQIWDSYAASRNVTIVTAAGNGGAIVQPGTAYNVISVGIYPSGFSSVSSPGERAKPDMVAPVETWDNFSSFATPVVSGAAALMIQAAGGSGPGTDARVVKSILLNGAAKPGGWTHSSAVPLDRGYGAGVLNVYNSYKNLTAGQKAAGATTFTTSLGGSHAAVNSASNAGIAGWNLGTITSTALTDAVDHYILDLSTSSALTTITTTLTWMRANSTALTNEIRNSSATTSSFTTAPNTINNLDLYLYKINGGAQADVSVSGIDNVEHLFTLNLTPGKYDLQVLKNGGFTGTANVFSNTETYGLAWNVATQSTATLGSNIVFNQTNSVSISTAIGGPGGISQIGTGTTTLTGSNSYGNTTISAGTLVIGNGGSLGVGDILNNAQLKINNTGSLTITGPISGNGSLTYSGGGTATLLGLYSATGALVINSGVLQFSATNAPRHDAGVLLKMKNLTMASNGRLDVANRDLLIGNASLLDIETKILAGFGKLPNGNPSGPTDPIITSSTMVSSGNTFLVPIDADAILGDGSPGSAIGQNWDNVAITESGSVIVKYTYSGDADLNGKVDYGDYGPILANFGQTTPGLADIQTAWLMGDLDLSGFVDYGDYGPILATFGQGVGNPLGDLEIFPAMLQAPVQVPEPASLIVFIAAAIVAFRRSRPPRN